MEIRIRFTQAIEGFELSGRSRHLSEHTLSDYRNTFKKLTQFTGGDPYLDEITQQTIEEFLASREVSPKTILNYHVGLSALWTWAVKNDVLKENIIKRIEAVKPAAADIDPFSEQEIRALLSTITKSKVYLTHGSYAQHLLPQPDRNRAIILTLVDTGIRASELGDLLIRDLDIKSVDKALFIRKGKGSKSRRVPISPTTAQAIWRYLTSRPDARLDDPLFCTTENKRVDRLNLRRMLIRAGERAGVKNVFPHRFRHTFAINYLRNGGNIYTLQAILGHTKLDTCRIYLKIAQADIDVAHRQASPVDHWRL